MILLLAFAFLSGLVTILAPCIWPVLPIVLSSSIQGGGGHKRPLGITIGVMLSFLIFTLSVSTLVALFGLDPNVIRLFAVIIIALLGLTMVVPALAVKFELAVSRLSNIFNRTGKAQQNEFLPGFVTGLSLGVVWSPCAGPILASIAALAATGNVSIQVVLVTLAYVIGVGIPLFAFAYGGQRFVLKARGINKYTARIQQVFGVIMIITALLIYTNKDKELQIALLDRFPVLATALNGFETSDTVTAELRKLRGDSSGFATKNSSSLYNENKKAPEFVGITKWLNLPEGKSSLTLAELKGKVVLVDVWTYTCINCVRTLPHVTSWYEKYKDKGFVVVGVHTPEFAFEKETSNVQNAIKQFKINYPVAQDNDFATWNAYENLYWPAEYLIDSKGVIRRTHFGEGKYDEMEEAIQGLLKEAGQDVEESISQTSDQTPTAQTSPETYLGSGRMLYLQGRGKADLGEQNFERPKTISLNKFSFVGNWTVQDEFSQSGNDASLIYNFIGEHVYLVLKKGQAVDGKIEVFIDGKVISPEHSGLDVTDGVMTVSTDKLYDIVDMKGNTRNHLLELRFKTPGVQAFAFTFG
ncbi:MAG: cytochrome c biogenesis protein DipZ [Candidatus Levybacteria bacterium]|nr:cytochrome c biogenesis protein DipZ [Candidatus Levybacteria bacterium]